MRRRDRDLKKMIKSLNLEALVITRSKHVRIELRNQYGRTITYTMPSSGSCRRGMLNALSDLKRFAREGEPKHEANPLSLGTSQGNDRRH